MASTGMKRQPTRYYPAICWNCTSPLPPPVTGAVLRTARALLAQPSAQGTSRDIVAAGVTERATRASDLLRQAERAGLVQRVGTQRTGHGRAANLYRAERRVVESYGE